MSKKASDFQVGDAQVWVGDSLDRLSILPNESVQACVTSPPYFGLRDYGVKGQIGLEASPAEYIDRLVAVFREVARVLAVDGTLWLNLGDTYDKNKQLLGIPWRVALALQEDGWLLRQDIIWHKTNAMPESVRDRCTTAHEYIFLFSRVKRYQLNSQALKEPAVTTRQTKLNGQRSRAHDFKRENSKRGVTIVNQRAASHRPDRETLYDPSLRHKRSVWSVATRPYKGSHTAVYPPELIEPCVLASTEVGQTVLDPFHGSGTTGEVALIAGRKYIGIELNPEQAALSRIRLEQAMEVAIENAKPHPQMDLFEACE